MYVVEKVISPGESLNIQRCSASWRIHVDLELMEMKT